MHTRAIALAIAPALFVLACGSSAPPPKDPANAKTDAANDAPKGDGTRGALTPDANDSLGEKPKESSGAVQGGAPPGGGKAPEAAVVDTKEPLGGGTLSQEDIRQIVDKSGDIFSECYTLGAGGKNKSYTATVKVKATLGPSGTANSVDVLQSSKNPKVDQCVANAFKKIKFPPPKSAGTSVITFPITFGPLEEVKR